ncbi:unnamed protein product [Protopolystoma xenopodis]|uniref:NR LBD domain-containing protein n=1 Tax=Protopolystoma xenopodis TaxID=117903 RepID=A0A448WIW9_9PLAT|nr:unnamed protein product [Protopolystoma xenopodis]
MAKAIIDHLPQQKSLEVRASCWLAFHKRFNGILENVIRFAKRVPGFVTLDSADQITLVRHGCFEVCWPAEKCFAV